MRFFFGLLTDGRPHVITGLATPTLKNVEDLSDKIEKDADWEDLNWGPTAPDWIRQSLAYQILKYVKGPDWVGITKGEVDLFEREVIAKLETGKKWMISQEDVEKWLATKVTVQ